MSEDAIAAATARIDRALARIDAAARMRDAALADIRRRHGELRDQVAIAIAAIDVEIVRQADQARADG